MDQMVVQVRQSEAPLTSLTVILQCFTVCIMENDARLHALYGYRGTVEAWERYLSQWTMRMMISATFQIKNVTVAELDESMGAIDGGRDVQDLTNKASFEEFEEQEPLHAPISQMLILAHELKACGRWRRSIVRIFLDCGASVGRK